MRKILLSATTAVALAAPLVLGGAASASTAGPGPVYVTSYAHQWHLRTVCHRAHMAHRAHLGY